MRTSRITVLVLLSALALLHSGMSRAGAVGDGLEARWRGAWVILNPAVRSNCDARHTNNRVNGELSQSKGRFSFPQGELAQVKKISVQRSRVDVLLDLEERRLTGHQDGPFTLYDRQPCRVELEIETHRQLVKQQDLDGIETVLAQSFDALVEVSVAVQNDPDYVEGFGYGVDLARDSSPGGECPALMKAGLGVPRVKPATGLADEAAANRWSKGHPAGTGQFPPAIFMRSASL